MNGRCRIISMLNKNPDLTSFQRKVLIAATGIGRGRTITYARLADRIDSPRAARAVGQALARNPYLGTVPCHRVVAANGPGGYVLGESVKRALIEEERNG